MFHFTRRKFIKSSAVLLGGSFATIPSDVKRIKSLLLAFSTLGCPDWSFQKITSFAADHDYQGIELRGIQRQLDLTKCSEFTKTGNVAGTLSMMKEKKLHFVDLGSSANLHMDDPSERKKNFDEARRFIDLAHQINCPFIRVFPNNLPKDKDRKAILELITKGLMELGDYANGSKVTVLMETHGDVVKSEDIEQIMIASEHPHVGLLWDITNMWSVTKEPPRQVYQRIKKYIRHIHVKDLKFVDGKEVYTLLGKGEVPVFEVLDALHKGGYSGYYSFEWEKLWHPEIEEPEIAFADYSKVMKQYFAHR